jgi:hypothetical protein
MAFTEKVQDQAFPRAGGLCECKRKEQVSTRSRRSGARAEYSSDDSASFARHAVPLE